MTTPNPERGCWCLDLTCLGGKLDQRERCDCCLRAAEKVRDAIVASITTTGGQGTFPSAPYWTRRVVDGFDRAKLAEIIAEGEK